MNWKYSAMRVGYFEEFGIPIPEDESGEWTESFKNDEIRAKVSKITVDSSYQATTGEQYEDTEVIDVAAITSSWIAKKMMATEDHPERLVPRIARALEKISKQIETKNA